MTTRRVQWHHAGNLQRLESRFDRGCYIFAYRKPKSEVVYVGTASSKDGFMVRWAQHLGAFRRGARTLWRPEGCSVLELMSSAPEEYPKLSKKALVWIPGKESGGIHAPHFPSKWTYEEWWDKWVNPHYLWDLEVFACPLESDREAKILETQLQVRLSEKHDIRYYTNSQRQSWLGKREVSDTDEMESLVFEFDPIPREDSNGQLLLSDFNSQ